MYLKGSYSIQYTKRNNFQVEFLKVVEQDLLAKASFSILRVPIPTYILRTTLYSYY